MTVECDDFWNIPIRLGWSVQLESLSDMPNHGKCENMDDLGKYVGKPEDIQQDFVVKNEAIPSEYRDQEFVSVHAVMKSGPRSYNAYIAHLRCRFSFLRGHLNVLNSGILTNRRWQIKHASVSKYEPIAKLVGTQTYQKT